MAKILVLGAKVPFTHGGQDVLVRSLCDELKRRGHTVDTVELPLSMLPKEGLLNQAAIWRTINFETCGAKSVDLVIATKFPSYYARHPKKSVWLVHQHRPAYDLYGTRYSDISDDPRDEQLRQMLVDGDSKVLSEAAYVSGISKNVVERLKIYNAIKAEVLYPPLSLGSRYRNALSEDFILSVGRLCAIKRLDLMIKALPQVHNFVKLKVVGVADEPGIMEYYRNEIEKHHLSDRVEFLERVDNATLIDLYARCLCVFYAPYNEDYGYVTLEAMASGKPIIAGTDSGGVLEFVQDGKTGIVAKPDTDSIGRAVNILVENKEFASSLGNNGKELVNRLGLVEGGWDKVVAGLLSPIHS